MTPEIYIKAELARQAHRMGAHTGGLHGMLAMAFLLRNRQRAGMHGGDWMEVLRNAPNACGNPAADAAAEPFSFTTVNRDLLRRVDDIYSGQAEDGYTCGALYYAELHRPLTEWFKSNILAFPEEHAIVGKAGEVLTLFA